MMRSRSSYKEENEQNGRAEPRKESIAVILETEGKRAWPVSVTETCQKQPDGSLRLSSIFAKLKQNNFDNDYFGSSVSYYHNQKKIYVFCFFVPQSVTEKELLKERKYQKTVPIEALAEEKNLPSLKLKFRKKVKSKIELLKEEQELNYANEDDKKGGTKQKQKTIAEVIEKVALWRKLYTGFPDEKEQFVHCELEEAATHVGVIKKTLDDYLLQIRNGKRYGFNFQKRKNEKIGELRGFVKEKRGSK